MRKGAKSGQRRLLPEDWKRARKLYESGLTYDAVAGEIGCNRKTLTNRAKRDRWRLKDRTAIVREAALKARAKIRETTVAAIERRNNELLERGEMLSNLMLGEINARAKELAAGRGDASEYRAIVSAYKDLVHTLRLQTGQSTTNIAGKMETTLQVETWEEVVARMGAERGLDKKRGRKVTKTERKTE